MDTTLLHEFVVLVEHLNYSTAARMMNMSQSSLSRHIHELERYFGTQLFYRKDKLTLTHAGQILLEEYDAVFAAEKRIKKRIKDSKDHYQGTILIEDYAFAHEVRNFFLRAINCFRENNPAVMFEFRPVKHNLSILDSLREGYFDVGVLTKSGLGDPDMPLIDDFHVLPLRHATSPLMVYTHASVLPDVLDGPVSLAEFREVSFLLPLKPEYASFRDDLTTMCQEKGFVPKFLMKEIHTYEQLALFDMTGCAQIVRAGDVDSPSSPFLMNPNCKLMELEEDCRTTPYLLFRKDGSSDIVDIFMSFLESFAADLVDSRCPTA